MAVKKTPDTKKNKTKTRVSRSGAKKPVEKAPNNPVKPPTYSKSGPPPEKKPEKRTPVPKGQSRVGTQPSSVGRVHDVQANQATWRVKLQQSRVKFDDLQKEIYLNELADTGLKAKAAMAAGVAIQTVANHVKNDPEFAEQVGQAVDCFRDKVVEHHKNLLFEGEITRKYDKEGHLLEEKHSYPIRLIELELKRVDQEYRDKQTIDLNATAGGVLVAPPETTPERWIEQQEKANANKDVPDAIGSDKKETK